VNEGGIVLAMKEGAQKPTCKHSGKEVAKGMMDIGHSILAKKEG